MLISLTTISNIISLLILLYLLLTIGGYICCFFIRVLFKRKINEHNIVDFNSGEAVVSVKRKLSIFVNAYMHFKCRKAGESNFLALRLFLFKYVFGMHIGSGSIIYKGANIREPGKLRIGNNTIIGSNAKLDARSSLVIGNNVNVSDDVWIWTNQHDPQDSKFAIVGAKVIVEDYAWISSRVTILPGITIGKGSVIAAGAVVTKSTVPYTIYGGVPARIIGKRTENLEYSFHSRKDYAPFY